MNEAEDKQVGGLVDWRRVYNLLERKEYCQLQEMVKGIKDIEVLKYIIRVLCERLEEQDAE